MLVTIYYTDMYAEAPSAMERITVPESGGWSRWRAYFRQHSTNPTVWCLAIETYQGSNGKGSWVHSEDHCPLKHECSTRQEYLAWLTENVMAIYTDGAPYWISPTYSNDEKVDVVIDTEHGFTGGD